MGSLITNFTALAVNGAPITPMSSQWPAGDGQVFYCDPTSGNDALDGGSPATAKATLQAAVNLCTAQRGDTIIRMPGTETVTAPVSINVRDITIIAATPGYPPGVMGEAYTTYNSSATGLSAAVVTAPCRLVGLGFAASDVSEEALLIDAQEAGGYSGGFISIEGCRFALWNGNLACSIRMIAGALNHVIGCVFDGVFGDYGTAAIILEGDTGGFTSFYPQIIGNRFQRLGSAIPAIQFATGSAPDEVLIAHNYVGSEGILLDNNSEASDGLAVGNYLGVSAAANGGAAVTNTTNMNIKFIGNKYLDA